MEFKQKYFWFERNAKIVSDGVECYSKTRTKSNVYFAPFDQLSGRYERQEYFGIHFPKVLGISLILGAIPLIFILQKMYENGQIAFFILILTTLTLTTIYHAIETKDRSYYWIKGTERGIAFFLDIPKEKDVKNFVELILEKRIEYLVSTYGKIDKDRSREDNLSRIVWLKDKGAITPEKFMQLKSELERVFYGSNPIGFLPRESNPRD